MQSLHLLYHELRPSKSRYSYVVGCDDFDRQMTFFQQLQTSQGHLRPEVTFDDGHVSNYEYALPILEAHGVRAHFFITAGWTGQRSGYMNWEQLRALGDAGHTIGAHGWSHALLTHCTDEDLQLELKTARQVLEDNLGRSVTTMSLPGGRYDRRVLTACQEAGYRKIFTSVPRAESLPVRPIIGRLNVRGDMTQTWIESLFAPDGSVLRTLERQDRIKAAAKSVFGDRLYARIWALVNRQEAESDA